MQNATIGARRSRAGYRGERVAIVSPEFHPRTGGIGDYSLRLGSQLAAWGADIRIFAPAPVEPHPQDPDVSVHSLESRNPLRMAAQIERIAPTRVLLQYVPHMLGARRIGNWGIPVAIAALRRGGIPVTVVAHELSVPWARRPDRAVRAASHRALCASLLACASRVVVTTESRAVRLQGLRRAVPRGAAVQMVPVGANALPRPKRKADGRLRVGTFSTLSVGKRFDVVLETFARIAREVPDAELVLIGDIDVDGSRSGKRLQNDLGAHPYSDRIRLTGRLSLEGISRELSELDVYLFPNDVGATTRSGTLPAALGTGLPIVAVEGIETGSVFRGDYNIVFARSLSGKEFAREVMRLYRQPNLARRIERGARDLYERHLDWPVVAAQVAGGSLK